MKPTKYLLFGLTLIVCGLVLQSCGQADPVARGLPSATTGQHVDSILRAIGLACVWGGGVLSAVAGIASLAGIVIPALALIRGLFITLAELGGCAVITGTVILYVGDHPWILPTGILGVAVYLACRYHLMRRALQTSTGQAVAAWFHDRLVALETRFGIVPPAGPRSALGPVQPVVAAAPAQPPVAH